jgi:hypothetical protein
MHSSSKVHRSSSTTVTNTIGNNANMTSSIIDKSITNASKQPHSPNNYHQSSCYPSTTTSTSTTTNIYNHRQLNHPAYEQQRSPQPFYPQQEHTYNTMLPCVGNAPILYPHGYNNSNIYNPNMSPMNVIYVNSQVQLPSPPLSPTRISNVSPVYPHVPTTTSPSPAIYNSLSPSPSSVPPYFYNHAIIFPQVDNLHQQPVITPSYIYNQTVVSTGQYNNHVNSM